MFQKNITEEEVEKIKENIINSFKDIITTINEQKLLAKYIEKYNLKNIKFKALEDEGDENGIIVF